MEIIGYISALLVGVTLGLIGGGGSILTIPILVYFFKIDPILATSYSLFIVGVTSIIGSYKNYQANHLNITKAFYFLIPATFSILLVRKFIIPNLPNIIFHYRNIPFTKDNLIMVIFSILMLLSSLTMILKKTVTTKNKSNLTKLSLIGLIIGVITGFLGAGGGFLIIPALLFFGGLEMKNAVGTSLFIIALNATIGFIGDILNGININYTLLISLTIIATGGILIGTFILKKISSDRLKPTFGWFVLIVGLFILFNELTHSK